MGDKRIDEVDSRIVEELRRNARLPVAVLARRVGLSRNAVRQRVERLERDGLIAGYTIVPGKELAESRQVTALMMVYRRDRMRGADVLSAIRKIPEVESCYIVSGEADLIVQLAAASQERINQVWSQLSALPGVVDTKTAIVLSTVVSPRMV
jgi:Lrp/AsnC family transcriptional regulator, leucine-responsive regulatory protein